MFPKSPHPTLHKMLRVRQRGKPWMLDRGGQGKKPPALCALNNCSESSPFGKWEDWIWGLHKDILSDTKILWVGNLYYDSQQKVPLSKWNHWQERRDSRIWEAARRNHEVQRTSNSGENCYRFKWKQFKRSSLLWVCGSKRIPEYFSLFSGLYSTYLFFLQLPRQILLVDELGRVKRTGLLPTIFSAYLVDLSVDTTELWQLKHCNIRTSWNRLWASWKPHENHMEQTWRAGPDKRVDADICKSLLRSEVRRVLGCSIVNTTADFGNHHRVEAWRRRWFCFGTSEWPKPVGSTALHSPTIRTLLDNRKILTFLICSPSLFESVPFREKLETLSHSLARKLDFS